MHNAPRYSAAKLCVQPIASYEYFKSASKLQKMSRPSYDSKARPLPSLDTATRTFYALQVQASRPPFPKTLARAETKTSPLTQNSLSFSLDSNPRRYQLKENPNNQRQISYIDNTFGRHIPTLRNHFQQFRLKN